MAAALLRRRRDAGLVGDDQLALPHAGHFQRPPIIPTTVTWNDSLVSGGTPESDVVGDAGLPVTTIDTPLGEITYLPSLIEMPDIKPGYVRGPQLWAPPC